MSPIVQAGGPSGATPPAAAQATPPASAAAVRRLFWRVHFWAGLVTAPLVLFAAFTGLLYVFTPQIEARVHADVDRVPVEGAARPLDAQVAAALASQPGWTLKQIVPAAQPGETTQVLLSPPVTAHQHGAAALVSGQAAMHAAGDHTPGLPNGRIVYVDPARAEVVGALAEMQRFKTWAKKLHSSALQGDAWRWPIELAASWMLLMFATGIAMWWPSRRIVPRLHRGRTTWRDLHTGLSVLMSGLVAVVLITGLTWSRQAGDHFRNAQAALGQASPKPPMSLLSLQSQPMEGREALSTRLSMQAVLDRARAEGLVDRLQLTPPRGPQGMWRADALPGSDPTQRLSLVIDAGNGAVLWRSGWADLPVLAQATAVGIPFHRGEFGVWNQVLLTLVSLTAIFSVVSGVVMWWWRRPVRASGPAARAGLGVPSVSRAQLRAVPWGLWLLAAALAWAMPVFGLSALVFIGLELAALAIRGWRASPSSSVAA